jgi:hypothetical protein
MGFMGFAAASIYSSLSCLPEVAVQVLLLDLEIKGSASSSDCDALLLFARNQFGCFNTFQYHQHWYSGRPVFQ